MIRFGNARVQKEEYSMTRTEALEVLKRMHSEMTVTMNLKASIGARHDLEDTVITARLDGCKEDQAMRLAIEHLMRLETPVQFGFHVMVPATTAAMFVLGIISLGLAIWLVLAGFGMIAFQQAYGGLDPMEAKVLGAMLLAFGVWVLTKVRFW